MAAQPQQAVSSSDFVSLLQDRRGKGSRNCSSTFIAIARQPKLTGDFRMLEDTSYQHVVRWSEMGDSFIVLDNNEFTKSVLPRHFKHSNFASFVRQLNKHYHDAIWIDLNRYDFHKVRNNEEGGVNPYGEGAWEFKHRDFKRKAPTAKKLPPTSEASAIQINDLQSQIESITRYQDTLTKHLQGLSRQYQGVVSKMLKFQRTLSTQDSVMQNIIQYIVNPESTSGVSSQETTPFLPCDQAQKLISSYDEAAKASVDIMNDLSQLGASLSPGALVNQPPAHLSGHPPHLQEPQEYPSTTISPSYSERSEPLKTEYKPPNREGYTSAGTSPESPAHPNGPPAQPVEGDTQPNFPDFDNYQFPQEQQPSGDSQNTGGLRVFTVGHFAPRQDDDAPVESEIQPPPNMPIVKVHEERSPHSVRIRRQTFVPGWSVPPKILLVDDDVVYRNMSSKFLQVFGCEADVAVDGLSALDKLNMEKYDLILMDVVMPNLDGIAATNIIRQFDLATPIISMTSNIHSNDIMHYFNSGMNDVLPKPFTKDSLLGILEKHLLHMKQMQQMQQMGYSIPAPMKNPQLIELPSNQSQTNQQQESSLLPSSSMDSLDDPNLQFSYKQGYNAIFGPSPNTSTNEFPAASTGKRRAETNRDTYEYLGQSRTVPRSGGDRRPGKRARHNTPPW